MTLINWLRWLEGCVIFKPGNQLLSIRDRLRRNIEPIWPCHALTPSSRCPHGNWIMVGRICGVCHEAERITQEVIEKLPAAAIEEPESRASRMIEFFQDWLKDHPRAPTRMKLHIVRQIRRQERILRAWMPTRYIPRAGLKGGVG